MAIGDKELKQEVDKFQITLKILKALSDGEKSIAELSRTIGVNRSTLRYYLSLLQSENKIYSQRMQSLPGRPTKIFLNKVKLEKEELEFRKKAEEYSKKQEENPITLDILMILNKEKQTTEQIFDEIKKNHQEGNFIAPILSSLSWLRNRGLIKETYEITPEGKKFFIQKDLKNKINKISQNNEDKNK